MRTKLDFHQRQELSKILQMSTDEDAISEAISQLIHDRDASQRLFVDVCRDRGFEPCARVGKPIGSLLDMTPIVWEGTQPPEGALLYSAVR